MGCYDTIEVPCPSCGAKYPAQSKSGDCELKEYELDSAPEYVLFDVNRHAPFECWECGTLFEVEIKMSVRPMAVSSVVISDD